MMLNLAGGLSKLRERGDFELVVIFERKWSRFHCKNLALLQQVGLTLEGFRVGFNRRDFIRKAPLGFEN